MGRTALFVVMGLAAVFTVIGINLNKSAEQSTRVMSSYMKYTQARNLARSAVHSRLRDIDRDSVILLGKKSTNFYNGVYESDLSMPAVDTLRMTAKGRYEDTTYTMTLVLQRHPTPFPQISAALGVQIEDVVFEIDGKPKFLGNDHDILGNDLPGNLTDLPGAATLTEADSGTVKNGIDDGTLAGTPPVAVDPNQNSPLQYKEEYINAADVKLTQANSPLGYDVFPPTWGSAVNPKIIYIRANPGQTFIIDKKVTGYGLMILEGNILINDEFFWTGPVLSLGKDSTSFTFNVNAKGTIVGGIIVAGQPGSKIKINGDLEVKYSNIALQTVQYVKKLMAYKVVRWYE